MERVDYTLPSSIQYHKIRLIIIKYIVKNKQGVAYALPNFILVAYTNCV